MLISVEKNTTVAVLVDPSDEKNPLTTSFVEVFTKEKSLNGILDWRKHKISLGNVDAFEEIRERASKEEVWVRTGTHRKEIAGRLHGVSVDRDNADIKVVLDVGGPTHHQFVDCPSEITRGFQAGDEWVVVRGTHRSIEDLCGDVSVIIPEGALCSSSKYTAGQWRAVKGSQFEQLVTWKEYQEIRGAEMVA